jgi:alkylated DNA repair protein (DNA oxidative demethylase)
MLEGFRLLPGLLGPAEQAELLEAVLDAEAQAPFYTPLMPRSGAPMSVLQTNLGELGWFTDQAGGYRYEKTHPVTGAMWPSIPSMLFEIWRAATDFPAPPEACLVNLYRETAKMGLHVDADEAATEAPVVSVSLGDAALFRLGGHARRDPTHALRLSSGDVVVLAGAARSVFHGVDRIYPGTSRLVPGGGRINLTLRRVTKPG